MFVHNDITIKKQISEAGDIVGFEFSETYLFTHDERAKIVPSNPINCATF